MKQLLRLQEALSRFSYLHRLYHCLASSVVLLVFVASASAQQISITGKVVSADDQLPVPGATVMLKGSTVGTVTDMDGNYALSVPDRNGVLVVSFVGMKRRKLLLTIAP